MPTKPTYLITRSEAAEIADRVLAKRADRPLMESTQDFFAHFDQLVGGDALAAKMAKALDGLMAKAAFSSAGALMVQIQKLRLNAQRQAVEEDLGMLDLDQKREKLKLEIARFMVEQQTREVLPADQPVALPETVAP